MRPQDMPPKQLARYLSAIDRYAAANASDPFVRVRACTHLRMGILGYFERGPEMVEALYDAVPYQEERIMPDGSKRTYLATVYRNVVRP